MVYSLSRQKPNGQYLVDPLSLNLYTYGHNNPVRYKDPSGRVVTEFDRAVCTRDELRELERLTAIWHNPRSTQAQRDAAAMAARTIREPYVTFYGAKQLSNGYVEIIRTQPVPASGHVSCDTLLFATGDIIN